MSKIATRKASPGAAHDDGAARASSGAPQLLSQIPGSVFTSPGFILGIVAFEILYGLFLFAVMSSSRKDRAAADTYADAPPAPAPPPRVALAEPPHVEPAPPKPEPAPAKPEPAPAAKDAAPPPAPKEIPKPSSPPAEKSKRKKSANKKKNAPKDTDKSVALAPSPKPVAPVPKVQATIAPLGPLIDPLNNSAVRVESDGLTIIIPPGLHIFDLQRDIVDAPRALADVDGDFLAEVKVPGEMRPGPPSPGVAFNFQGAGLLLWQDRNNYVRFERASFHGRDRAHRVFIESAKDGKPGKSSVRNVREGPITLRLERKGRDLIYSYSSDGKTWIKLDQSAVNYAAKASVGISASNASARPLEAQFTNFVLKQ